MPTPEKNPKPAEKPTEGDVRKTEQEEQNVDRDGRERQPNQHSDRKG